ncbi:MAG: DUF5060 domain-containing protein [Armatimonas sp.]
MTEISFQLPGLSGNPFHYVENDIQVKLTHAGGGTLLVPAFFDGGTTWKARVTPKAGRWQVAGVTRNKKPIAVQGLTPKAFTAKALKPGFIRRDPALRIRLMFDDKTPYYPIGHNVGWKSGNFDITDAFAKLGAAGENWSRVWMCHWDNKNLDWGQPNGQLSLEVARRWDAIVAAAEKNGVYFQMVLQHHGPYSSNVNSNWPENPWNTRNGGFLSAPEEFFTHPKALELTRLKFRYILARYGHSPSVLAWELFNEVEWCDGTRKNPASVAAWHRDMAAFLRLQDLHTHLVTTSSDRKIEGLYQAMDYIQPHLYAPDPIAAAISVKAGDKPLFFGEVGPSGDLSPATGAWLHDCLWASLMTDTSGAAQYWAWDHVEARNLYSQFASAVAFVKASGLAAHTKRKPLVATSTTTQKGTLSFAPGGNWGTATQTEFTVAESGVAGMEGLPSFLQGEGHREMLPHILLNVTLAESATLSVQVAQSAKGGGHLVIEVDGAKVAEQDFPAANRDTPHNTTVEAKIPAGAHKVRVVNTGADWLVLRGFKLAPFGSALRVLSTGDDTWAAFWAKAAEPNATGQVTIPGLKPGRYEVTWWDTGVGKPLSKATLMLPGFLPTPPVNGDLAGYLRRL